MNRRSSFSASGFVGSLRTLPLQSREGFRQKLQPLQGQLCWDQKGHFWEGSGSAWDSGYSLGQPFSPLSSSGTLGTQRMGRSDLTRGLPPLPGVLRSHAHSQDQHCGLCPSHQHHSPSGGPLLQALPNTRAARGEACSRSQPSFVPSSLLSSPFPLPFLLSQLPLLHLDHPLPKSLPLRLPHSLCPGDQIPDLNRVSQTVGGLSLCRVWPLPQKRNTKLETSVGCSP